MIDIFDDGNVRCNAVSLFVFTNFHSSSSFSLSCSLKTNEARLNGGVPLRGSGEEKLNDLLHEVTGDGTAVMGTVLREIH